MSRKTYVYDKATGKMVEKTAEIARELGIRIIPDINEYQVVGPEYGKVITSRSRHREYLKRHNLMEIGDQKPKWMQQQTK